jgi:uncharacterized membrane protein YpjA
MALMTMWLRPDVLATLIAFNAVGAIWGFFLYAGQLSQTAWYFWPLTPDWPLISLCFMLFLWWIREGKSWRTGWKSAVAWIAVLGSFKYAIWTVVVMGQYILSPGSQPDLQDWILVASQLGLLAESLLYRRQLPKLPSMYAIAMTWFLFNDYADWMLGIHSHLPATAEFAFAMWLSLGLTVAIYFWGRALLGGIRMNKPSVRNRG